MRHQNGPNMWAFPAILTALAIAGCEARPRPWVNEIPTATVLIPSTASAKVLRPTPFNFVQAFVEKRLRKRDEYPESVCGFIGGDVASPAVCSTDSACLWDQSHGVVGCTATEGDNKNLAVYTTCVDSNNDGIASLQNNPWVFTCTDECYRNSYESISGQGFTQWGCGSSGFATTVLTQPSGVDNQSAKVSLTSIEMTIPTSSSSSESSTSSSSSSSSEAPSSTSSEPSNSSENSSSTDPPSSTSNGGNPPSTTSGNPSSTSGSSTPTNSTGTSTPVPHSDSSTNVGAIAGGAVGGIAGLALIVGLLLLFKKRRNQERLRRVSGASGSNSGPHDMGEIYEPKELDATTPEIPSELPGDLPMVGPSKPVAEPVELPGSEVPMRPETEKKLY